MAYMIDATSISIGSLFGSPSVTAYIESGAGISEGILYHTWAKLSHIKLILFMMKEESPVLQLW